MPFPKLPGETGTHEAMLDPQVGDVFSEGYSFWLYVVHRSGDAVATLEARARHDKKVELPKDGELRVYASVDEFRSRFAYEDIDGYWVVSRERGCDVTGWYEYAMQKEDKEERP